MKNLTILGSTGSIGSNTLRIVEMFPDRFSVKALTGAGNIKLLAEQILQFKPEIAAVLDKAGAVELKERVGSKSGAEILYGEEGYKKAATYKDTEIVVAAIVGGAGLIPTLAAIDSGKDIALANKETLVMAGDLVMRTAAEKKVRILPVDSEHSAIFQSLQGNRKQDLDKILLTASGGPFINRSKQDFPAIKPEDALNHPNWQMGQKISIDSATLMNKGLEVIEAKWLFSVPVDKIKVLVHPQSIVHSMVAYIDGSVIAQLGIPDMKSAIAYALSYPERIPIKQPIPEFPGISLTFKDPDSERFPCLELAFEACRQGGTMPAVLNAANEAAVNAFLNESITFPQIPEIVRKVMQQHTPTPRPELSEILKADRWARKAACEF
jgi:1-deoxy-D-xylulose-5-phosphate reductoisomerase